MKPNYKLIYSDIIDKKFPDRKKEFQSILSKNDLSFLEIINLNRKIFQNEAENKRDNQRHKSYNKSDILQILEYQKKHKMNNSQVANYFRLSRNTVSKWKKIFVV
ncbi:DNA-binding transcriptional regulator YiaG [Chryseobacterium sp. SORGH_AS 447]|nr:DNA-binding transcriptional regulator YiaG [Chryseobacterium sp. SORGH_AS_0447]